MAVSQTPCEIFIFRMHTMSAAEAVPDAKVCGSKFHKERRVGCAKKYTETRLCASQQAHGVY